MSWLDSPWGCAGTHARVICKSKTRYHWQHAGKGEIALPSVEQRLLMCHLAAAKCVHCGVMEYAIKAREPKSWLDVALRLAQLASMVRGVSFETASVASVIVVASSEMPLERCDADHCPIVFVGSQHNSNPDSDSAGRFLVLSASPVDPLELIASGSSPRSVLHETVEALISREGFYRVSERQALELSNDIDGFNRKFNAIVDDTVLPMSVILRFNGSECMHICRTCNDNSICGGCAPNHKDHNLSGPQIILGSFQCQSPLHPSTVTPQTEQNAFDLSQI
jgi:hypothetical protein